MDNQCSLITHNAAIGQLFHTSLGASVHEVLLVTHLGV